MATEEAKTTRAGIQTYVPEYQKEEWAQHADEMDMSLSEFVRSMVQAGRRGFEGATPEGDEEPAGIPSSTPEPPGSDLDEQVLQSLSADDYVDWDELLSEVTDDIEDRLDEVLGQLRDEDRVQYSDRHGGYTLE